MKEKIIVPKIEDTKVNRSELEERAEWLVQDYDNAVEAGLKERAQKILQRIHKVNDTLGEKRFDPADVEENLVREQVYNRGFEMRTNKLISFCRILLERPDDLEANQQIREILKPGFVQSLTNEFPSRGYVDVKNKHGYTFIKLTDEISLYGESDAGSFKLDKFEILKTLEARKRIVQMEADENLVKEHK